MLSLYPGQVRNNLPINSLQDTTKFWYRIQSGKMNLSGKINLSPCSEHEQIADKTHNPLLLGINPYLGIPLYSHKWRHIIMCLILSTDCTVGLNKYSGAFMGVGEEVCNMNAMETTEMHKGVCIPSPPFF